MKSHGASRTLLLFSLAALSSMPMTLYVFLPPSPRLATYFVPLNYRVSPTVCDTIDKNATFLFSARIPRLSSFATALRFPGCLRPPT